MDRFFSLILDFFASILDTLDVVLFEYQNFEITLLGLIFAFLFLSIVINLFWKGAKA